MNNYSRYSVVNSEVSLLEKDFSEYIGYKYCIALSSCGQALSIALRSLNIKQDGDYILTNAFSISPVIGSITSIGAIPYFIEINEDLTIDFNDLEKNIHKAKILLISHMRGIVCDMDKLVNICNKYNIILIEDCAHTMNAKWNNKYVGTYGLISCFSTQSNKHIDSGEGGLLITNDDIIATKTILYSGSYKFYDKHIVKPHNDLFEKYFQYIPNLSCRMDNIRAKIIRKELKIINEKCSHWRKLYDIIDENLIETHTLKKIKQNKKYQFIGSYYLFYLINMEYDKIQQITSDLNLQWYGNNKLEGTISKYNDFKFLKLKQTLPKTDEILSKLIVLHIPYNYTEEICLNLVNHINKNSI